MEKNISALLITDREKIRKTWEKSDSEVFRDIQIIKDWCATQKHLPEIPSDQMIEFFLTNCKYSIEKTKQNLDMYYTARDLLPDIYRGIHPVTSRYVDIINQTGDYVTLPKLTPSLHRISFCKYSDVDPDEADIFKFLSHIVNNIYEVRIHEDLALGEIYISDMTHIKFGVLKKLTPTVLKQFATVLEKVHSNRVQGLHFLYSPSYVNMFLTLFKTFLNKKLQDRIFVHQNIEDLYEHVPQEMLPRDYGGKEKSIKELKDLWSKQLGAYKERFDELENMHVDESLRPVNLKNDEFLGFHGNFNKINID